MSEVTDVSTTEQACGYQIGDWDCRPGGYMYDAGSGEGWDPEDCSFICPHCRTKDYLLDAKEEAETCSSYSNNWDSGTGVTIWAASEARAIKANRSAAIRALIEIGVVHAIEDADNDDGFSVVLCNTQPALALLADYDTLAAQRDEGLAREAELTRKYDEAIAEMQAVIDTGALTTSEHESLEAEICARITDYWKRPTSPGCADGEKAE